MTVFPVIASTLSAKALGEFAKVKYPLNASYECKLFRTGMNHTYFLSDSNTQYVLRVYSHNWRSKVEIEEELTLLKTLHENHISVSYPIKAKDGAYIQEIQAPEGIRYVVLFSFAAGEKRRFMSHETCFEIGALLAKMHQLTLHQSIDRISYTKKTLLEIPYKQLQEYFSEAIPAMQFIKEWTQTFQDTAFEHLQKGIVHMDLWYDNMAVSAEKEITFFDFDFCGNGWHILDIGYFCKQLFFIETDKEQYEQKATSFLKGYHTVKALSQKELDLLPTAGASIFVFYLGIQAQRFDWSNIFLTENYLNMFVGRIKSWTTYYDTKTITLDSLL